MLKTALRFAADQLAVNHDIATIKTAAHTYAELFNSEMIKTFPAKVAFIASNIDIYRAQRNMVRNLVQSNLDRGLNTQSDEAKALVREFEFAAYMAFGSRHPFNENEFEGVIDEYSPEAWGKRHTFIDREEFELKKKELKAYGD